MSGIRRHISKMKATFGKLGKSPAHDWYFALLCFVAGIVIAIVIDGLVFASLSTEEAPAETADLSSLTLSGKDIQSAIDAIEKDDANSRVIPDIVKNDPAN